MTGPRHWPVPSSVSLSGGMVTADPGDAETLSQVIAEAFFDLAPSRWLIPDPGARRKVFPGYFRIYVEHALAEGVVHTTPDRSAAALWLPIGVNPPPPDLGYGTRLATATSPWTERSRLFDKALERHHPSGVPHHYLAILAVDPRRQGQGAGTELLCAHHATLDAAGMPAYLEASDARTRRLYFIHGYEDRGPPIRLAGGPLMHPMWRRPHDSC